MRFLALLLADAEGFLARYPAKEGQLTVLSLDARGVVTAMRHVPPEKELAALFATKP